MRKQTDTDRQIQPSHTYIHTMSYTIGTWTAADLTKPVEYNHRVHLYLTYLLGKATENKIEGYHLDYLNPGNGDVWLGGQYRYTITEISANAKSLKAIAIDVDTGKKKTYKRLWVKNFIEDIKWNYENNC